MLNLFFINYFMYATTNWRFEHEFSLLFISTDICWTYKILLLNDLSLKQLQFIHSVTDGVHAIRENNRIHPSLDLNLEGLSFPALGEVLQVDNANLKGKHFWGCPLKQQGEKLNNYIFLTSEYDIENFCQRISDWL